VKRFWKAAEAGREEGGWAVRLDGKPLKTPMRELLLAPTEALARAIAGEWNSVGEQIDPRSMPLTGLANAAIDRVRPNPSSFAAGLAKYAEADLACYRAERPSALVERQAQSWDALLGWARRRFDVDFRVTSGIVHVDQPQATVDRLSLAISVLEEFRLAGLSPLVTMGGSLVAALAVLEGEISAESAWDAVTVDERWQLEQWGADPEAEQRLENNRRDFLAAARFLELLSD
jgi:chaperone required for assembly of F1-ATPase